MTLAILSNALFYAFIFCCLVSAVLQIVAWTRHSLGGAPASVRALWEPQRYFDSVGQQQIQIARRLLTVGAVAYLCYGALMIATGFLGRGG